MILIIKTTMINQVFQILFNNLNLAITFIVFFILNILLVKLIPKFRNYPVKFSYKNYYVHMIWVVISYLFITIAFDQKYIIYFFLTGIGGMVAETALAVFTDMFFTKSIWEYNDESIIRGYTSKLNFLPWTTGAIIFLSVAKIIGNNNVAIFKQISKPYQSIALFGGIAGLIISIIFGIILELNNRKDNKILDLPFSLKTFFILCIPIFSVYLGLILLKGTKYLLFFFFFAIVGNVTEYFYSIYISKIFGHRLWTYNYLKLDDGHSSITNLPLWSIGGLYFYFIADLINLI